MAGGRRNPSRSTISKPVASLEQDNKRTGLEDGPPIKPITPPKHMPIPEIPKMKELAFETFVLVFSLVALALQYLNIYRTVFWLPHSYTRYAMNLYLIDKSLVWFIVATLSRRIVWSIVKLTVVHCVHQSLRKTALTVSRVVFICIFLTILIACLCTLTEFLTYIRILALAYPFLFYLFMFEMEIGPFLEVIPVLTSTDDLRKDKQVSSLSLYHMCSNSPDGIRSEVDVLTKDCNKRMAQVMYQTIIIAYYTTFIPSIFVPNSLHYDVPWVMCHALFVATTCFMWHLIYCYPARYCDVLHRSTLHLGGWSHVESRSNHGPYNSWSNQILWPRGALVKHQRELYRAEGVTNAAEPGNATHARLFTLFSKPWKVLLVLVALQTCCSCLHFALLLSLQQWQQVLATAIVLSVSYAALYCVLRDYLVLKKVYQQEEALQERSQ